MNGLYRKYSVVNLETGKQVDNCFVLRPKSDPAAVAAIQAYAEATDNEKLRGDLLRWVGTYENYPLTIGEMEEMADSDFEEGGNRIWLWDMEQHFALPALVDYMFSGGVCAVYSAGEVEFKEKDYGKTWLPYARKPYMGGSDLPEDTGDG